MPNLGQVSSILYGTAAPSNTNVVWCKTTTNDPNTWAVLDFLHYINGAWTSTAYTVETSTGETISIRKHKNYFNAAAPFSGSSITLDLTDAIKGEAEFKSDGTEIITFNGFETAIFSNTQNIGAVDVLKVEYDGTNVLCKWLVGASSETDGIYIEGDGNAGTPFDLTQAAKDSLENADSSLQPDSMNPTVTAGNSILFDNNLGGRRYNAAKTSTQINLDFSGAKDGGTAQFVSDGTEVTINSSKALVIGGAQNIGTKGSVFMMYDASEDEVYVNWIPSATTAEPPLDAPTFTLSKGNTTELNYSNVLTDVDSTLNVAEISTNQSTWFALTPTEYTDGDTNGTITEINGSPLQNGTLYYVRITSSAPNRSNSTTTGSQTPVLFFDDFTDLTKVNQQSGVGLSISTANNELVLEKTDSSGGNPLGVYSNPLTSLTDFRSLVFTLDATDIITGDALADFNFQVGIAESVYDANERTLLAANNSDSGNSRVIIKVGGSNIVDENQTLTHSIKTYRQDYIPSTGAISFKFWNDNTEQWEAMQLATGTANYGTTNIFYIWAISSNALQIGDQVKVRDVYFVDVDFTTKQP